MVLKKWRIVGTPEPILPVNYLLTHTFPINELISRTFGHNCRYHNREAVVMSALQVEKHPLSTPGPYATPPMPGKHFGVLQMTPPLGFRNDTPRTGSPVPRAGSTGSGSCVSSPRIGDAYQRPHSSPKMKLRFTDWFFCCWQCILMPLRVGSEENMRNCYR